MILSRKAKRFSWALFVLVPLVAGAPAPPEVPAQTPVTVLLIGEVLTPGETGEVNTYRLDLGEKTVRFRVDQGVTPSHSMESNTIFDLLGEMGPARMRVAGRPEDLAPLLASDAPGRHFRIEGALYPAESLLNVTQVAPVRPRASSR